jgi:hypothetical protein
VSGEAAILAGKVQYERLAEIELSLVRYRRPSNLSPDQMRSAISRLEARVGDFRSLDVATISRGDEPEIQRLSARITSTLSQIYGEDTNEFARLSPAADLDVTAYVLSLVGHGPGTSVEEIREGVKALAPVSTTTRRLLDGLNGCFCRRGETRQHVNHIEHIQLSTRVGAQSRKSEKRSVAPVESLLCTNAYGAGVS